FTVVVVGAKAYGQTTLLKSEVLGALGFAVCNGQPCFVGIVPGITTAKKALTVVSNSADMAAYSTSQEIMARMHNLGVTLIVNPETEKIISIQIPVHTGERFPHIDSFIAMYGLPCAVEASQDNTQLILNYPNMSLGTKESERLTLGAELWFVELSSTETSTLNCTFRDSPT